MLLLNFYNFAIILFCLGLYMTLASQDLMKKLFGLAVFQTSVLWFFIGLGKVSGAAPPILSAKAVGYSNPLPHVLMLTAIVVGIAILALGFALIIRINKAAKLRTSA